MTLMSPPSSRRVHFADLQKIQVDLIGTENTLPGQPKVVFYVFCVRIPCSAFVKEEIEIRISKRYSDFRTLNGELEQIIGNLPGLPSKTSVMPTWFGGGNDMNALSERKVKLYEYLRSILKIPAVLRCQKLWAFLDFAVSNISVVDEGVPQLKLTLNDPRFGVNAVCYDAESGIVLSACEDSDPVSRLSTLVVNKARMAFDKRSEKEKIPMGIFNVWKRGPNSIWDVVCSNTFDCQATALAWDRARQRCFLGLDNGFINVYSVPHPFQSMTLIKEIQVHALRISELIYDPSTDVLFSCSRDKTVSIFHCGTQKILDTLEISDTWVMSMTFDSKNRRIICGSYNGSISIIATSENKLRLLHTISDHKECVRSLFVYPEEDYLFSGSFDSVSRVYKLGTPVSRIQSTRVVAALRNGPKSKVKAIAFCPYNRQIVSGHDNGMLAFWNSSNGNLEYVDRAHYSSIVSLFWLKEKEVLLSASRDGNICFWKYNSQSSLENPEDKQEKEFDVGAFNPDAPISEVKRPSSASTLLREKSVPQPEKDQSLMQPTENDVNQESISKEKNTIPLEIPVKSEPDPKPALVSASDSKNATPSLSSVKKPTKKTVNVFADDDDKDIF